MDNIEYYPKRGKKKIYLYLFVILLLILFIIIGYEHFYSKNEKKTNTNIIIINDHRDKIDLNTELQNTKSFSIEKPDSVIENLDEITEDFE
jgi:hypothetical protein